MRTKQKLKNGPESDNRIERVKVTLAAHIVDVSFKKGEVKDCFWKSDIKTLVKTRPSIPCNRAVQKVKAMTHMASASKGIRCPERGCSAWIFAFVSVGYTLHFSKICFK